MTDLDELEASVLDFPFTYRAWVGNRHRTTAAAYDRTYESDTDLVSVFDYSRLSTRDQREGSHLRIGGDLGMATEQFRYLALVVDIKRTSHAALEDAIARFRYAFDVQEAQVESPSTRGIFPLSFYSPTLAPPTGLASPVQEMYYARPDTMPQFRRSKSGGKSCIASVQLVCEDPRRYAYSPTFKPWATLGSPLALPNWGSDMGATVHPVITLVMSGNGASNLTISDGTRSLVLDMSAAGSGTFTIDCFAQRIWKGSTARDDLRTSQPDQWPLVLPGGSSWTIANTTNVTPTSTEVSYRAAR